MTTTHERIQFSHKIDCQIIEIKITEMVVVPTGEPVLPPTITGGAPIYHRLDKVVLNCTSNNEEFDVRLAWSINGRPARGVSCDNDRKRARKLV